MNDTTIVRSAAELERKYNLSKLAGLSSNVETNNNELIKIQNELTNMLNTLIINLGDVLDDNISLWFYPGIPNTLNEPYISWSDPTEHIGDIYYDQNSGNVYKYKLTNIEYLLPSDVKKMQEGNWDLSIFTCSYDNQKRITYRFELVN